MGKFNFSWEKITESINKEEAQKKKGFEKDPRLYKAQPDEKGNATAILRFLPDSNGTPFVKYYTHNFPYMIDGIKKYWIRNCINTFGYDKDCPICKKNMEYWNSAYESDKALASQRKRKLIFVSNVLVVKNPSNPELEGTVMLYMYGQKIYDKIKDKMFPSDDVKALGEYDEFVPFDLYEGANFKLVQVKQGDFPNYDKSEFGKQGAVGTEKQIEAIMEKVYDLSEFISEDKFPQNHETIQKLGSLLGLSKPEPKKENLLVENTLEDISTNSLVEDDIPDFTPPDSSSSDDPDEDFFKNL